MHNIWPNSLVFYLVANPHLNTACHCGRTGLILEEIQVSDILFLRSLLNQPFWEVGCLSRFYNLGEVKSMPTGDLNIFALF